MHKNAMKTGRNRRHVVNVLMGQGTKKRGGTKTKYTGSKGRSRMKRT
jgi:hypothetical protein